MSSTAEAVVWLAAAEARTPKATTAMAEEDNMAWQRSPVPLDKDEVENAEVRALAAKLAPALEEADALFAVPAEFRNNNEQEREQSANGGDGKGCGDNDSIDEEIDALRFSEQALRDELELASDFSNLFRSTPRHGGEDYQQQQDDDSDSDFYPNIPPPPPRATAAAIAPRVLSTTTNKVASSKNMTTEADVDPHEVGNCPEEEQELPLLPLPASAANTTTTATAAVSNTATQSSPATAAATTGTGMLPPKTPTTTTTLTTTFANNSTSSNTTTTTTSFLTLNEILIPAVSSSLASSSPHAQHQQQGAYTNSDHFAHLRLEREEQTWYSLDWSPYLCSNYDKINISGAGGGDGSIIIKELCLTIPDSKLKTLLVGLPDQHTIPMIARSSSSSNSGSPARTTTTRPSSSMTTPTISSKGATTSSSPSTVNNKVAPALTMMSPGSTPSLCLPVRTIFMRIRGDVLCGAVMDAVLHALLPPPPSSLLPEGCLDESGVGEVDTTMMTNTSGTNLNTTTASTTTRPRVHIQKRQGGHLQAIVGGTNLTTVRRRRRRQQQQSTAEDTYNDHGTTTAENASGSRSRGGSSSPTATSEPAEPGFSSEEELLQSTTKSNPPFFLDVQLCTQKSENCERMLLVRVFHLHDQEGFRYDFAVEDDNDDENDNEEEGNGTTTNNGVGGEHGDDNSSSAAPDETVLISQQDMDEATDLQQCLHLREACALIQRVESPRKAKRIRMIRTSNTNSSSPLVTSSRQVMQDIVSDHLLHNYQACPSVNNGGITLPSLNPEDWPVVVESWRWIKSIWEELESRDLSYNTLRTARFGAFPALPTLDVHYCSQMRRLSREDMIVQLLKSASELEDFARDSEYACANMISLLQPTFETYGMAPPALPKPTPLTAYPLDYCAPQVVCPPWGQLVMEALNRIQAWTKEKQNNNDYFSNNSDYNDDDIMASIWNPMMLSEEEALLSVESSEKAVRLVLTAFQKQDDEEKGARLGRKNMQVMDRLAKMQEHERISFLMLHQAHLTSDKASKAADDCKAKSGGVREVPLLKWSIVVGGATGTCMVTANNILFVTQLIPYIGGTRSSLFKLRDVDFKVQEGGTPSLLNPLPTIISVTSRQSGEEVYSFRPSSGGARLKSFLDIVQSIDLDSMTSEVSSRAGSEDCSS